MDVENFVLGKFGKLKEELKERKFCLQCKKEIFPGTSRFKARKFCSRKCNRRYFSLRRYYKIKDDVAYKDYRKAYMKKWVNENRERFNASMRTASLKYQKRKKEEMKTFNKIKELNKIGKNVGE